MNTTTRLLKVTAALGLGVLIPGLLNAAVVKQSFSYDAAGHLTGVSVANQTDAGERYRYDASGNIVEKSINGETVTMTYDAANQLMTQTDATGTTRFVYDSAGRLVEEQRGGEILASYTYGYLDKVTSVTRDGVVAKFHYNARGMLVAKERDGKIIETLGWDGIGLVARDDTVFANEAHVSGGVPLVAATSDGTDASYFDSDYLGTTTASYTADGEVNAYVHGSFGQGTEFADARFTGKHYDADLGAHVFPFRNYRSDAGRWTSADPAGFPDGPNQHFYAPVPTMGLDPWGLATIELAGENNGWSENRPISGFPGSFLKGEIEINLNGLGTSSVGGDITSSAQAFNGALSGHDAATVSGGLSVGLDADNNFTVSGFSGTYSRHVALWNTGAGHLITISGIGTQSLTITVSTIGYYDSATTIAGGGFKESGGDFLDGQAMNYNPSPDVNDLIGTASVTLVEK